MNTYPAYDAGELRPCTYSDQSPSWWGVASLAGMVSVFYGGLIFSYFYLRMGQPEWPPFLIGPPDLALPTIGSVLLWLTAVTLWRVSRSASGGHSKRAGIWLLVSMVLAAAFEWLKIRELFSLPFGWDNLPYGSIFWVMNGFQFLNVAAIILWTIPLTILAFGNRFDGRRRAGLEANRLYWNTALVWWVFFYLVLYYAPRVFAHVS